MDYQRIKRALAGQRLPVAFVDLDAFDRNAARVAEAAAAQDLPLRIASKSLRVAALLRRLQERHDCFRGLLCFAVEEAAYLADQGFDDLLVAYPAVSSQALAIAAQLARRGVAITLMADEAETVARIGRAAAAADTSLSVALCVDMSLRLGGRVHLGVRRSPLRTAEEVVALARTVATTPGCAFAGIMGYEAQVAGLGDDNPFEPLLNPLKRAVKRASVVELTRRRAAIVRALEQAGLSPTIVNGGGSGSLDSTSRASGCTEVTAGSAFFKPHLFDYYRAPHMRALEPACFFALEVTRHPAPGFVTCAGGGYVASGPPGPDKVPLPWRPEGLSLLSGEMCGEVQTPLVCRDEPPALGEPIVFRHAKGGELAERFATFALLRGDRIEEVVPTYRGDGQCFF